MKKSIVYLGLAIVSFANVAAANELPTSITAKPSFAVAYGSTPLCTAISKGEVEFAKKMIEYGADVNEKSNGMTPLMVAARYNQVEILNLLLEKGAKTKEKADNGFTALKWAEATGAQECVDILKNT